MSDLVLITLTGLGLGALYFLVASGLSLIFGLMGVLNFAHGAFLTAGAYGTWWAVGNLPGTGSGGAGFWLAVGFGTVVAGLIAGLVELALIRPLYERHTEQVLVTVGLSLAMVALTQAMFTANALTFPKPAWTSRTSDILGASVPNDRFLLIAGALVVFVGLMLFLRYTRYGLIIRAGVENRSMVTALGIDVQRAFTLVFVIGGAVAGLAGALSGVYFTAITPGQGTSLLIFAFIVVVIGGLGSLTGCAIASVLVALVQQYVNFYGATGVGDFSVVLLLAAVLLLRPSGLSLSGRPA